jgi:septal ring factor EnvC (AmiA/AmiB activator)
MGTTLELDESFDFGFSVVDENELEVLQQVKTEIEQTKTTLEQTSAEADSLEERLNKLYSMVIPLLNNLAKNPDKNYIYWPNRLAKIDQFRAALDKVYQGA